MKQFVADNLTPLLRGKKILLGVTGSIAAFKAHDIIRYLKACGAEVKVVLSESGEKFVTRVTLETLSGNPVLSSLWDSGSQGTHHIDTARWADLVLVAPATANTLEKLARGEASDLLTTEILAFRGPVLVAPAMNPMMYSHPAVAANVARIRSFGYRLVGPVEGVTSCGEEGLGRMVEPEAIVEAVWGALAAQSARSHGARRLVVTLGPTRSALDPVRYLTNRSSGLMGAAIAWAGVECGYDVTAIAGPTEAPLPGAARVVRVTTAAEMSRAALEAWGASAGAAGEGDLFVAAAAVLDWDVANPAADKLKKEKGAPSLEFARNPDILAEAAARRRKGQFVLGFAAETREPVEYGLAKLKAKGCDAVFANDVSREGQGFESADNSGWWITPGGVREVPLASKAELARAILALVDGSAGAQGLS